MVFTSTASSSLKSCLESHLGRHCTKQMRSPEHMADESTWIMGAQFEWFGIMLGVMTNDCCSQYLKRKLAASAKWFAWMELSDLYLQYPPKKSSQHVLHSILWHCWHCHPIHGGQQGSTSPQHKLCFETKSLGAVNITAHSQMKLNRICWPREEVLSILAAVVSASAETGECTTLKA